MAVEPPDAGLAAQLAALDPETRRHMTASFLNLGLRLEERRELAKAIPALECAVAITPEDATPRLVFGLALADAGRYNEAEEQFHVARDLAQHPDRQEAADLALARLYQRQGRYHAAIRACQDALMLNPASATGTNLLAENLLAAGHAQEALEAIGQALKLDASSPNLRYTLGRILRALDRPEEAIATLSDLAAQRAPMIPGVLELALAMKAVGRTDEALALFERVLQLEPTHLPALEEMAEITVASPDDDPWTAVTVEQGLILDPNNPRLTACRAILERRYGAQTAPSA
jgi:tetratricopeptide (TPR) repeat protein